MYHVCIAGPEILLSVLKLHENCEGIKIDVSMKSLHITMAHGTWREKKNARRSEGVSASRDEFFRNIKQNTACT